MKSKFLMERITESRPKEERPFISKIVLNGLKLLATYGVVFLIKAKRNLGLLKIAPLVDEDDKPIVSLTTFPKRINHLWMVLYMLYQQTVRPGKIVITLADDEFPNGLSELPTNLRVFKGKGVEFLFEKENLKPHNKYFYTMNRYRGRLIITVDDDLLYYNDTIERLMTLHNKYPWAVCANRCSRILFEKGKFASYLKWKNVFKPEEPSHSLIGLGYAGILYPPQFGPKDLFNIERIRNNCLMADDLWLKVQEILGDIKVATGSYYAHPITLPNSQTISLQSKNNGSGCRNDVYLDNLASRYKELLIEKL